MLQEFQDEGNDSGFRKCNRPERYDRNLAENTLKAIKKIDNVRVARAEDHHKNRMEGKKSIDRKQDAEELEQNICMIKPPLVLLEDLTSAVGGKSHGRVICLLQKVAAIFGCVFFVVALVFRWDEKT